MKHLSISAKRRDDFGKKASKAVRVEESVPCVIYGGGDTIHFSIDNAEVRKLIYTSQSFIIDFDIEGKKETVVMREVQYHPVTDEPLHIDFYRVIPGKPVVIDLPVKLFGNAEGVKLGGKLQLAKRKLRVSAMEADLPDSIDVDVTEIGLGKSVFVSDITVDKVNILTPPTTAICAVRMTRAARGAAAAAAAAEKAANK